MGGVGYVVTVKIPGPLTGCTSDRVPNTCPGGMGNDDGSGDDGEFTW